MHASNVYSCLLHRGWMLEGAIVSARQNQCLARQAIQRGGAASGEVAMTTNRDFLVSGRGPPFTSRSPHRGSVHSERRMTLGRDTRARGERDEPPNRSDSTHLLACF